MCCLIFEITFAPMTLFSWWLFRVLPQHQVLRIACVISLFGGWIRYFAIINNQFWLILVGCIIISCALPLYMNVITQFTNLWFNEKERTIVTTICGVATPTGNIFAFILAGTIYKGITTVSSDQEI